jgi:hypothetical protein
MPITKECYRCEGERGHHLLVNPNSSDEEEFVICEKCKGEGVIHYMTEGERDYKENN